MPEQNESIRFLTGYRALERFVLSAISHATSDQNCTGPQAPITIFLAKSQPGNNAR
jgi:hypothetical protein